MGGGGKRSQNGRKRRKTGWIVPLIHPPHCRETAQFQYSRNLLLFLFCAFISLLLSLLPRLSSFSLQ